MLEQTDIAVATLISKFNDVTPQLIETFRKQISVSFTYDVIGISISIILFMIGLIGLIWAIKTYNAHEEGSVLIGIFSAMLIITGIVLIIATTFDLIQIVLNPDYYILERYIKPLIT